MRKCFFCLSYVFTALSVALAFDPPQLISTSPQFWAVGVNAARQKTVSLAFASRMRAGFSAWFGPSSVAPESFSETTLSADGLTFSLGVGLAPGKVYAFGLNELHIPAVGFQTEKGISLPPTFLVFQTAGNVASQDAPPHVIRSSPQHGATVDRARVQSLVIAFDKPMNTKKHGLHMFENNNPVDLSKAQFAYSPDGLTFTLPYAFKPATQYRFELNDIHDIGFSATNRVPLWPVQISFNTAQ
jgi:hypothetical protein